MTFEDFKPAFDKVAKAGYPCTTHAGEHFGPETILDAIEKFAADVSHEIKNPLTSIKSAVETATKIRDSDKRDQLLALILDDVNRLDRLITDISDSSRLDAELSRETFEPIDIKINAITKRVTPKKKVDLIILELIEVVTAENIARKQKSIISQSSIFFNLFRSRLEGFL